MTCRMKATLSERTFRLGDNRYKVDENGGWSALMFGWWPNGQNPRWQWHGIPKSEVPKSVLEEAQ